jgi:hypothetical protein
VSGRDHALVWLAIAVLTLAILTFANTLRLNDLDRIVVRVPEVGR